MNSKRLTIGIVDDRREDLVLLDRLLATAFEDRQLTVISSNDPLSAAEDFASRDLDIVFVDFNMGVLSGLDFLARVRERGSCVPAIMLTDLGDEELVVSALHAGFADYLRKSALTERSLARAATNAIEKHLLGSKAEAYRQELENTVHTLERKNREIASFYHTLAHELKTPLTSAREFASLVKDGIPGPVNPEQEECLELAIASCDHLQRCINDLFDVSRIDTGKLEVVKVPCALAKVVQQAATGMAPEAARLGIQLLIECPHSDRLSSLDTDRIVQVVTNIIGNALKFTAPGGQIVVSCEEDGPGLQRVTIADTGQGIAPEELDQIFDRLYQSNGNAAIKGGMGIGLHLCRQLVSLHGGEIHAKSVLGQGSTFAFTIPSLGA